MYYIIGNTFTSNWIVLLHLIQCYITQSPLASNTNTIFQATNQKAGCRSEFQNISGDYLITNNHNRRLNDYQNTITTKPILSLFNWATIRDLDYNSRSITSTSTNSALIKFLSLRIEQLNETIHNAQLNMVCVSDVSTLQYYRYICNKQ